MAKVSPIQNSFNAGELSPQLAGRVDLEKYKNGCSEIENFIPQIFGPAKKRPGTRFVREVEDSSKKTRLIPFEFSTTQAFAIEFGDNVIRFHADGGTVLDSGDPYEIPSPYSEDDIAALHYAQSADVIYLAHPDYPPHKLARFGATNWTITEITFSAPPFNDRNTTDTTLAFSAVTGNVTVTASTGIFVPEMVGSYLQIRTDPVTDYAPWIGGEDYTLGSVVQHLGNVYEAQGNATAGFTPPVHDEGTRSDGGVNWTFLHNGQGYAEVTGYTSTTSVSATVVSRMPYTSATKKWAESSWSARRGWPRTVTFYEDRLWFAGSAWKPQTIWASVVGDYENHEVSVFAAKDDDALQYTINTQDLNTISWMAPGKVLAVGTISGEFTLRANDISQPVTPTSFIIQPQTTYGCTGAVRPLRVASSILFLQRAGRKVREYTYNFETDSYVAPNMTLLSEHITQGGVVDMTYQQEPLQVVWAPRADGTLLGMTYERAEEVVGWHRQPLGGGGIVESVVSLPHWDGDEDVLWMIVRRTVDGQSVRYVEYMEKYRTDEYAFFVDCGLTYDGTTTDTITGLDHLEGETVAVLADGSTHPEVVVESGSITLNREASVVNVGLPYTARLRGMRIEAGAQDGVAQGKTQRIHNIVMRLFETGPGLWYGDDESMDELNLRSSDDPMDAPVPLFSGDTAFLPWPEGYEQGAQITIEHRLPLPCTIVALMPQLVTNDR